MLCTFHACGLPHGPMQRNCHHPLNLPPCQPIRPPLRNLRWNLKRQRHLRQIRCLGYARPRKQGRDWVVGQATGNVDAERFPDTPTKRYADSHVEKARKPQPCKSCDRGKTVTRQSSTLTELGMPLRKMQMQKLGVQAIAEPVERKKELSLPKTPFSGFLHNEILLHPDNLSFSVSGSSS